MQPNALSKHFFVGASLSDTKDDPEFYMRNTVVDVPYGAGQDGLFTASYAQPLSRIKWEVTENALVARQTYEHIQDSDHNGNRRTDNGQVVAMFAITSQFDIRRAYNPQTGEELNIVEENSVDRPWYEREYIRVDWSKNLVTDGYELDTLSQLGLFGGIKFDPMSYYVEDPTDPDAPAFDEKDGYFDVTTKAFASPQQVDTPWGTFPYCFFYGQAPVTNCNPTEVKLRLSFKRVVDNDYEPAEWNGNKMDAFGWFYSDRYGYERNYGVLDEKWHKLAAKYNIWQKSHIEGSQCAVDYYRDDAGNVAKYKTDGNGNFLTDPTTGVPIPATADDKNAKPFPATPVGADPNRDTNKNKTDDECEFHDKDGNALHLGAHCDVLSHKCSLPLHERETKTIPWFYGPDAAPDLFPSTARALNEWNIAVKRAAMIGRRAAGARVGADTSFTTADSDNGQLDGTSEADLIKDYAAAAEQRAQLAAQGKYDEASNVTPKFGDIFVLCHNPSITPDMAKKMGTEPDPMSCLGKDDAGNPTSIYARVGDIRYNMVNIITNPQTPSPWGIMVDADDPLTGEKVTTSVNEWGHVLDLAAQGTEDLLRWINGEISDDQITSGAYLREWAKATNSGVVQYQPKVLSKDEIQTRLNSISKKPTFQANLPGGMGTITSNTQFQKMTSVIAAQARQQLGPALDSQFEGARRQLIGTKFESMLVNGEDLEAVGLDPKTPTADNDFAISKASPLRGRHPELGRWLRRLKMTMPAMRHYCEVEQPEPDALVGLARQARRLYPLPEEAAKDSPFYAAANDPNYPAKKHLRDQALHQWIREQFHVSVILHEMGHSMGLRHNFTGSWDSLNYHPQYWQLRTRNGQEKVCSDYTTPHTNGEECVGPRWIDPVTDTETNGLIWKWGSSTVMDYPGDQTQDMNDIGAYDKAAMRFGYGDVVDVDKDATLASDKGGFYMDRLDGFGGISGPMDFGSAGGKQGDLHYSKYQDVFNVLGKCSAQKDPSDPLSATCSGTDMDYVPIADMQNYDSGNGIKYFAVDAKKRVRHPYMFGSDEYADFGNVPVFRFDSGADAYEQFQFLSSTYENRYIFDNFRRDRVQFNTGGVVGRVQDRYFDKFDASTKAVALYTSLYAPLEADSPGTMDFLLGHPGTLLPHVLASSDSFATWIRILTRPEPGDYYASKTPGMDEVPDFNNSKLPADFHIAVGSGEGRYLHNDYNYDKGYDWGDYQTQVGSYYEKRQAVYNLIQAYNHFIQNNKRDYIDGRALNINYATIYPEQMRRIFSQLMQNDGRFIGPYVEVVNGQSTGAPIGRVRYLPWEQYDASKPATVNLTYPTGTKVINPLVGWEEQYPALIDGFFFGGTTLTMDWVNQMRIYSPGSGDSVSIPVDQQVRYSDPLSGIEYVARNYGKEVFNGNTVQRTSGARMLEYVQKLAGSTFVVASTDPVTGEQTFQRDPITKEPVCAVAQATCDTNKATLRSYSANLDLLRQLGNLYGYGPFGRGE